MSRQAARCALGNTLQLLNNDGGIIIALIGLHGVEGAMTSAKRHISHQQGVLAENKPSFSQIEKLG